MTPRVMSHFLLHPSHPDDRPKVFKDLKEYLVLFVRISIHRGRRQMLLGGEKESSVSLMESIFVRFWR